MQTFIHIVPEGVSGIRLSDYAAGIFPGLETRSGVKKAIKKGEILLEGIPGTTASIISSGLALQWNKPEYIPAKVYKLNIDVVYEDDYLAIVNKPAGIAVSGNRFDTLENGLVAHLSKSTQEDCLPVPRAIHRLDSATSGLLIIAKTQSTRIALGRMLEQKEIEKTYQAVVIGETPLSGILTEPINGKEATTRFERIETVRSLVSGKLTLLKLYPETGRTHQIRIHLASAGYPILGDKLYGDPGFLLKGKGLFLCAVEVGFRHPVTNQELTISIDSPQKFRRFLDGEQRRWEKYSPDNQLSSGGYQAI
jgi:23S rRNA pseudouridine1911/1915/1917 synthase